MNLSNSSLVVASRSLWLVAGICAAGLVSCNDDDNPNAPNAPDARRPDADEDAGQTRAARRAPTAGAGGAMAVAGTGGDAGAPVVSEPASEDGDSGVADLDGGSEPVVDPNPSGFRDLSIEMSGFDDEVGKYMQLALVAANDELLTMGMLNELPSATYTFELPDTIPPGQEVALRVWSDTAGMAPNAYDAAMDHAWTQTIAAGAANERAVVELTHGTQTPPPTVDSGEADGSLGFMLMGTPDYYGDRFELRVYEDVSGRLVARYVAPVPGFEVAFDIHGVLKTGTTYRVDFSIDVNKNMTYDEPPADASWRRTVTATATGNTNSPTGPIDDGGPGAAIWLWELPSDTEYVDVGF
jgi:hypothetical protein